MNLTAWEQLVLCGVWAERERLARIDLEGWFPHGTRRQTAREVSLRWQVQDARQNVLPYDPEAWLAHPLTNAQSQACRRAVAKLEEAGLLERLFGPGLARATHLRLTPEGEAAARSLAAGGPELGQSREGA